MQEPEFDLAVVGAGAVGLSIALWAQDMGLKVALVDRGEPGGGTSFGNAGTIATYACAPVNSPSVLTGLPRLLFHRESPLRVSPRHALANLPWMFGFLRNCTPRRVETITRHLARLLDEADGGLDPLFARISADDLVVRNGCFYLFATEADFAAAAGDIETRRRHGVAFEVIDGAEVKAMEPGIAMPVHKALHFTGARHITDPGELMRRLHGAFVAAGGDWVNRAVVSCAPGESTVGVTLDDGGEITCGHLAIAAGAWSREIRGSGAEALPLDTERGYHLMFGSRRDLVSRPVGWAKAGFYATPMRQGLRIAGTVEIAGIDAPPDPRRLAYLRRKAEEMLGPLGEPSSTWLGFRPTMPDALPVIGRSQAGDRVLFAFGHQHVGLTLSGITGRYVAGLASGNAPNVDLSPYGASRFG